MEETTLAPCGLAASRNFAITLGTTSIARSICASVLNRLNENRRLRRAPSPAESIARSTCEASCEPVRHADPAEQQMRCRSSRRSAVDDSTPSKDKLEVLGTRAAPAPLIEAPLTASTTASSNLTRIDLILAVPCAG